MAVRILSLTMAALMVGGCWGATDPSPTLLPTGEPAPERQPVIIDTDVGLDDVGAMLVLLRDPRVDVQAITISGTGLAHCQGGRLVVRYLIDQLGVPDTPFGCGRTKGGPDARPFPEEWRAGADVGYGFDIKPTVEAGTPRDAVDLLVEAVAESPSAPTLVTLGPLTNLEDAFAADATLPDRIAGIHAMLGTIDAKGNVTIDDVTEDVPVEWNAFADPSAVEAVFATDVPITIVPLDATQHVPVPSDLADRLATDRAAAGADLMYELLVRNPYLMDPGQGQYLWDELAALTLTDPTLAEWSEGRVVVGPRGELIRDDEAGRPIAFASSADQAAFEAAFLDALRRGGPRATPFVQAGTLTASWEGTTCSMSSDATVPGSYDLSYTGLTGTPSGVIVVGVTPPHAWAELEAFAAMIEPGAEVTPPAWAIDGGQVFDATGSGTTITGLVTLRAGTWGPVCTEGDWPNIRYILGDPFEVAP